MTEQLNSLLTRPRISVVERVYYQVHGEQPTDIEHTSQSYGMTEEQPFSRRTKVGPDWSPLPYGWVAPHNALVHIVNEEGEFTDNPTEAERARVESLIVHVAFIQDTHAIPAISIPPREGVRFRVLDASLVRLRCEAGTTRIKVNVFPG